MRKAFQSASIVAAIAALVTIPGLGSGTLWDNSETAYGEVAREILLTHDWVVMHLNGYSWFVQPPLYFWIAAICAKVFGVGSFALRLPSALATIGMGAMTAYAVARQTSLRAGLFAGVALSTCLMQAIVGRLAIMDALLDLCVALGIFWWFRAIQTGRGRYFLYGCVAAALGFLAKGPVAPVVCLLVIAPYYLWERRVTQARLPSWRSVLAGVVLFAAITAPWFVALGERSGVHAVADLIGHYTFGRYTGTIENQSGPVWYYLPVLILGFFPWIAFFPSAVAWGMRNAQPLVRLAFCWIVVPLLFFSFAQTKLPNYVALELPAFALLVALYLDEAVERVRSRSALISAAVVPLLMLLLAVAAVVFSRDNRLGTAFSHLAINLMYVGAAIFTGAVAAFVLLLGNLRARVAAPYAMGGAMICAFAFLAILALPQAEAFKPIPRFAQIVDAQRRAGDALAILHVAGGNALVFYTRPRVYVLVGPHDPNPGGTGVSPRTVICTAARTWLIAPSKTQTPTFGHGRRLVATSARANLYLYEGAPCRS